MDAPRQLFEMLKINGLPLLKEWVADGQQEDLYIEFKTARSPMETADKQNLAIGVTGFANSEGGILVWGVYASKDREGTDAAQELRPIAGLRRFRSNLNEYVSRLIAPAVQGVEHHVMPDSGAGEDIGYAVTFVPKSEGLPHMAMAKEQQRYYYRAGDSFLAMEHFMLADRFGRRPQPKLELAYRWETKGQKTYLVLGIRNVGKGLALWPALHIEQRLTDSFVLYPLYEPAMENPTSAIGWGLPERERSTLEPTNCWRMFAGGEYHTIHPGTTLEVARALGWIMPRDPNVKVDWKAISFGYSLYCDGFSLVEATETIPAAEVARAALS